MINVLAISGKRESGKTSLANALEKYGFKRMSLAGSLKRMCQAEYGLTDDQVNGVFKESPTHFKRTDGSYYTPRDILIREGCLKRSIDPDFWCKQLFYGRDNFSAPIVVDDIRFLNEISFIKRKFKAKFIRLERSEEAIGKAALDDLSETELDNYKNWDFKLEAYLNTDLRALDAFAEYIVKNL